MFTRDFATRVIARWDRAAGIRLGTGPLGLDGDRGPSRRLERASRRHPAPARG